MRKHCRGCGEEFLSPSPFICYCEKCLKSKNYAEEDKLFFEISYQEMCEYCDEIERSQDIDGVEL